MNRSFRYVSADDGRTSYEKGIEMKVTTPDERDESKENTGSLILPARCAGFQGSWSGSANDVVSVEITSSDCAYVTIEIDGECFGFYCDLPPQVITNAWHQASGNPDATVDLLGSVAKCDDEKKWDEMCAAIHRVIKESCDNPKLVANCGL